MPSEDKQCAPAPIEKLENRIGTNILWADVSAVTAMPDTPVLCTAGIVLLDA
jgi:hypothetical protein